jgi:hypothetical protein
MSARVQRQLLKATLMAMLPWGLCSGGCGHPEANARPLPKNVFVIRPGAGWTDLGDDLFVSVEFVSHAGPAVTILWRNRSSKPAVLRLEAPLGVSEADMRLLQRLPATRCIGVEAPTTEDTYEAGWNLSSFTIPPNAWEFSYLSGFVVEDRGCIVSLRVSWPPNNSKYVKQILIDAALEENQSSTTARMVTGGSELSVSAKAGAITRISDLHQSARLDVLVENNGSDAVQVSTELSNILCRGDWQPKQASLPDWIVKMTEQRKRVEVVASSWAIFSFHLTSDSAWPGAGTCTASVVVSEFDLDNELKGTYRVSIGF